MVVECESERSLEFRCELKPGFAVEASYLGTLVGSKAGFGKPVLHLLSGAVDLVQVKNGVGPCTRRTPRIRRFALRIRNQIALISQKFN